MLLPDVHVRAQMNVLQNRRLQYNRPSSLFCFSNRHGHRHSVLVLYLLLQVVQVAANIFMQLRN